MRLPLIGLPMTVAATAGRDQWALSPTYARAIAAVGGVPVPIPLIGEAEGLWTLYERLDGLLLCGGGDLAPEAYHADDTGLCSDVVPARDELELALTRRALADRLPLLGICRGIQVLNVAAGGGLIQDIPSALPHALPHRTPSTLPRDRTAHTIEIEAGSLLARLHAHRGANGSSVGAVPVNSTHHQAIGSLGLRLRVTAQAPDGIIEAVEGIDADQFLVGVQWHPEELLRARDALHRELFARLVRVAAGLGEG